MTMQSEAARLEAEIAEKQERLKQIRAPMGLDDAARLAKEQPDEFNQRFEAARRAGRNPIDQGGDK